jgi:hypothetical protein
MKSPTRLPPPGSIRENSWNSCHSFFSVRLGYGLSTVSTALLLRGAAPNRFVTATL